VDGEGYRVTGPDGEEVYDVFDTIHSFDHLRKVGHVSQKELVFAARNLPPLGIKLYYVENTTTSNGYRPFRDISASNGAFGTQVAKQSSFRLSSNKDFLFLDQRFQH
jgi:hypothetical protein